MKYGIKYLLILSLLSISATGIYGEELTQESVYIEAQLDEMQENNHLGHSSKVAYTNTAIFDLENQSVILNDHQAFSDIEVVQKEETFFLPAKWTVENLLAAYVSTEEDGKVLRIRRQETLVLISEGARCANVNGVDVALSHKVERQNGRYQISAEDLKVLFDIEVSYDAANHKLIVKGQDRRPNQKPEANFYFMKQNYREGQEVVAVNTSHDADQDEIVATRWSVGTENPVIGEKLSAIFSKPKAGTYTIGLQVQDARGLWSDWQYKKIQIQENKAPVIETLTTSQKVYAPGEPITFNYTYTNEEGEAITNEKWMYRKSTEEAKLAVLGKPKALFTEGEYIVTLQIDDAYGKRSKVVETTVHIEGKPVRSELDYFFKEGQIGDRIDNFGNVNYREYADANITEQSKVEGKLIMSDSPETVKNIGVLYEDVMEGKGRILLHHLNKLDIVAGAPKQSLGLIVSNDGEEPISITLRNEAIKGPATDITRIGQKVVYDYLKGTEPRTIHLQPGEKEWIYTQNWTNNQCISGMLDVETTGKARFIVTSHIAGTTLEQIDALDRIPSDGLHMSGSFSAVGLNYILELDGSEPTKLLLGDKGSKEWIQGIDVRTGSPIENKGNFGVSYYVTITANEEMGIFLNSRGSGIQGAIKWDDGSVYNVPTQGMLAQVSTRAAVIGTIQKGETKTFEYILPNGSSAPVLIGFVPTAFF